MADKAANNRAYYLANKERLQLKAIANGSTFKSNLKRYGLTPETYAQLRKGQDGRCAICQDETAERGLPIRSERTEHIDHCHATGKVRGLLCNRCNVALGMARDSPETLRRMASYLENHA